MIAIILGFLVLCLVAKYADIAALVIGAAVGAVVIGGLSWCVGQLLLSLF